MYALPSSPRPIGGVLDDAIRLYRASFARCWGLALTAGLLSGGTSLYLQQQMGTLGVRRPASGTVLASRMHALVHSPIVWICYLLMIVIWLVIRAAIIARQDAVAKGRKDSLGAALAFGFARLPSTIFGGLLWIVIIGAGMVALLVPGIWLWGRLELWLVTLCVEELGPAQALGSSWRLTEGNWWRATTIMTVAFIIVLVLSMAAGVAVGVALGFARGNLVLFTLVSQLFTALVSIFTIPMVTVVMLSIYYDLKLRHEGGDLAARLSSLQAA
jgi:hypothetical protein